MRFFLDDLRYALRTLRNSPGFTAATVLTLALGIGANSAIFSVVNAVLLRPLPFDQPDQLMALWSRDVAGQRTFVSQLDLDDWRTMTRSFSELASSSPQSVNFTGGEEPQRVVGNFVSANFFSMTRVQPAMGRLFLPGEDRPGAQPVAVLTDRLWHNRLGADPSIIGKSLIFNGEPYTVAGILPSGFVFAAWDADVYLPAFKYPNYNLDRAIPSGAVFGRLQAGVSLEQAQAEMNTVTARLAAAYPASNKGRSATVISLKDTVVASLRPAVLALAGAVAFVLLIGCANVASLLVARMVARERERAVRIAMGATRMRLMSHVLAETLVLAVSGGAIGMLLGMWSVPLLSGAVTNFLPSGTSIVLDRMVVLFTSVVSLGVALLVAAIPAWQSSGVQSLREGRGAGSGAGRNRARSLLVVGEVALALVLLVGSGLMIRSFMELGRVDPGFDPHNLLTLAYRVPRNKYPSGPAQAEFHRQVVEQIQSVPGVLAATSVRAVPMGGNGNVTDFLMADRPEPPLAERPRALVNMADPYFFATMRIPVLRGRVFTDQDQSERPAVVVINRTLARRYYADRDPIGQHVRIPYTGQTAEIIGVVGDVKQFGLQDAESSQIYAALAQNPFIFTSLAVRTAGDPMTLANSIRRAIWNVDKDQPVWSVVSMENILSTSVRPQQFVMWMLGGYAALALLLASIGIFGVVSYAVSQRTGEIGVRIALGAMPRHVAGMVLRQGFTMAAVGIVLGIAAAAWLTRYLQSQLFAVSPLDPAVYAIVAVVLASVALAACLIPARRAMRVDPVEALRHE
jgi:putative ABC transport system permease protein